MRIEREEDTSTRILDVTTRTDSDVKSRQASVRVGANFSCNTQTQEAAGILESRCKEMNNLIGHLLVLRRASLQGHWIAPADQRTWRRLYNKGVTECIDWLLSEQCAKNRYGTIPTCTPDEFDTQVRSAWEAITGSFTETEANRLVHAVRTGRFLEKLNPRISPYTLESTLRYATAQILLRELEAELRSDISRISEMNLDTELQRRVEIATTQMKGNIEKSRFYPEMNIPATNEIRIEFLVVLMHLEAAMRGVEADLYDLTSQMEYGHATCMFTVPAEWLKLTQTLIELNNQLWKNWQELTKLVGPQSKRVRDLEQARLIKLFITVKQGITRAQMLSTTGGGSRGVPTKLPDRVSAVLRTMATPASDQKVENLVNVGRPSGVLEEKLTAALALRKKIVNAVVAAATHCRTSVASTTTVTVVTEPPPNQYEIQLEHIVNAVVHASDQTANQPNRLQVGTSMEGGVEAIVQTATWSEFATFMEGRDLSATHYAHMLGIYNNSEDKELRLGETLRLFKILEELKATALSERQWLALHQSVHTTIFRPVEDSSYTTTSCQNCLTVTAVKPALHKGSIIAVNASPHSTEVKRKCKADLGGMGLGNLSMNRPKKNDPAHIAFCVVTCGNCNRIPIIVTNQGIIRLADVSVKVTPPSSKTDQGKLEAMCPLCEKPLQLGTVKQYKVKLNIDASEANRKFDNDQFSQLNLVGRTTHSTKFCYFCRMFGHTGNTLETCNTRRELEKAS